MFQGVMMGILSAFGSFSRVLGPVFVSYIYTNFGTYPTIGFMAGSLVLALLLTVSVYKRLVPMEIVDRQFKDEREQGETTSL